MDLAFWRMITAPHGCAIALRTDARWATTGEFLVVLWPQNLAYILISTSRSPSL